MWRETLKDYSVQEFEAAFADLVRHPPKYELEDGSIQVWRGMPKLPDVVNVMLDLRDKAVQDARRREKLRRDQESAEAEKRRAEHPEEFIGMKELQEISQKLFATKQAQPMPNVRTVWPDFDPEKNREKLRQQAEKLMEKP